MCRALLPLCPAALLGARQACAAPVVVIGAEDDWAPYSSASGQRARGFAVDMVGAGSSQRGLRAPGSEAMLAQFNQGYAQSRHSPRYREIEERWFK